MQSDNQDPEQFDIFISYAREDSAFARLIGKKLKNYIPPKGLPIPARRLRVFIDQEDIRGTDYFQSVSGFLSRSRKLLLVCSPYARRSEFVNDEIRRFVQARGAENIIPILVSGIPNNEATPGQEDEKAFPEALCEAVHLPLAVTYLGFNTDRDKIHKGVFYASWYTTLANVCESGRSEVEQRDRHRRNQIRAMTVAGVTVIIAALSIALVITFRARNSEARQRQRAETSAREAQEQRDIAKEQRNEVVRQRNRAEDALARASARLLTIQARDEESHSASRALLLAAAAVETTAGQRYVEPSSEQFLREMLSHVRGLPLSAQDAKETPMLYGFSPDGRWALTTGTSKSPILWELGSPGGLRRIDLDEIEADVLTFSPDSTFAVAAESPREGRFHLTREMIARELRGQLKNDEVPGGQLTLIPLTTAERSATYKRIKLRAGNEQISKVSFSPDGGYMLVTTSYPEERPTWLYQVGNHPLSLHPIDLSLSKVSSRANEPDWSFSPDGHWLISYMRQGESFLWSLDQDRAVGPYILPSASAELGDRWVEFSEDMKWLLTYGYSGTAKLWRLTGDPAKRGHSLKTGGNSEVEHAAFSPDGKWVLVYPCLWRIDSGTPTTEPVCLSAAETPSISNQIVFSVNSARLVLLNATRFVTVWDLTAPDPRSSSVTIRGHYEVSFDRRWMVKMQNDRPAKLWNLTDGGLQADAGVECPGPPVVAAAFANETSRLATVHSDGSIRVHTLQGADRVNSVVVRAPGPVLEELKFSPRDSWLIASSRDRSEHGRPAQPELFRLKGKGAPRLISLDDSKLKFSRRDGNKTLEASPYDTEFEFSPDERWLIAKQTSAPMVYCWRLDSDRVNDTLQLLEGHENGIAYFNFVAGSDTLVTSEFRESNPPYKRPRVWALAGASSYVYPFTVQHPDRRTVWAQFDPSGKMLAAIGDSGTLVVYRVEGRDSFRAVLIKKGMSGPMELSARGTYARERLREFSPGFDRSGRWFVSASQTGELYAIDCSKPAPAVYQVGKTSQKPPLLKLDAGKSLIVTSDAMGSKQLQVWRIGSDGPRAQARLNLDWARSPDSDDLSVSFVSESDIVVGAPAGDGKGVEVWRYRVTDGRRTRIGSLPIEGNWNSSDDGRFLAGSQNVVDAPSPRSFSLKGYIPHPKTYRKTHDETVTDFEYLVSPNGRWAVGRRFILEGYPEFGRTLNYAWRWVFDLAGSNPEYPVMELPRVEEAVFANFAPDSKHWVSVTNAGQVTIVTLPGNGSPQVTRKTIDQYFSGRYLAPLPFWPTGEVSYEVSLSPHGDWLATRRGDLMYLIRLEPPYEGKLLRGFEAGRDFSSVSASFGSRDDVIVIGPGFWRTRMDAELLWPVNLASKILAVSDDARWVVTESTSGMAIHPLDVGRLVERAKQFAGRDLTTDEREQFQVPNSSTEGGKRNVKETADAAGSTNH
jgi:WD40 repeat protein